MNIQRFLLIFRVRYKTVLIVTLGTVVVVLLASLVWPPTYKAAASVVVNAVSPDPAAGNMSLAGMPNYLSTQSDIIASDKVALKVVKLLKLDESPEVRQHWLGATKGKGTVETWLTALLLKNLEVKSSPDSSVLNINFSAEDPNFAAVISNAFAQAYIDTNLELQVEPARQFSRWFEEQNNLLHDRLVQAQARLSDYQKQTGIVITDQQMDIENTKLGQLSTQLVSAKGLTADSQSKSKQASKESMTDVLQNPVIQHIKSQIIEQEAKIQELGLGKNHPQYQSIQAKIDALRQKMDAETKTILSSISTSNQINQQREEELRSSIKKQKMDALENTKLRDKLFELQNAVQIAKKSYESLAQRMAEVNLMSHANQTNVSLLSKATAPISPLYPNMALNIFVSIFLGLIFGAGAAFIREESDRRVRMPEDMNALGLPMLAQIMTPAPKRRFFIFAKAG